MFSRDDAIQMKKLQPSITDQNSLQHSYEKTTTIIIGQSFCFELAVHDEADQKQRPSVNLHDFR